MMGVCIQAASILACSSASSATPDLLTAPAPTPTVKVVERVSQIPINAVKMSPESDPHPPQLYTDDFEQPIPLPGGVNTAGAEDSPFITADGRTLYFFFTPDVNVPVEEQILDGVTGIYMSKKVGGEWGKPERIILQDPGKLSGDGCEFVHGNIMWFCTVREGYTGLHWFTAELENGVWRDWKIADFNPEFQVGELHITDDGTELYFGSERPGGKGNLDIWASQLENGEWQEPVNISAVNTIDSEGWPAISADGNELWLTRNYGVWRSKKGGDAWQEAEQIISPLAGEPSIDAAGNLFFVHHFYANDQMIEADIYVAYKKYTSSSD